MTTSRRHRTHAHEHEHVSASRDSSSSNSVLDQHSRLLVAHNDDDGHAGCAAVDHRRPRSDRLSNSESSSGSSTDDESSDVGPDDLACARLADCAQRIEHYRADVRRERAWRMAHSVNLRGRTAASLSPAYRCEWIYVLTFVSGRGHRRSAHSSLSPRARRDCPSTRRNAWYAVDSPLHACAQLHRSTGRHARQALPFSRPSVRTATVWRDALRILYAMPLRGHERAHAQTFCLEAVLHDVMPRSLLAAGVRTLLRVYAFDSADALASLVRRWSDTCRRERRSDDTHRLLRQYVHSPSVVGNRLDVVVGRTRREAVTSGK